MDTELKIGLGLVAALAIFLGSMVTAAALSNETRWDKIDNTGDCYVKVDIDRQFGGGGSETRSTYCKSDS